MSSRTSHLEDRLLRLEKELKQLRDTVARQRTVPWWKEIMGSFKGDPEFDKIVRLGARIRKRDRKG